MTLFWIFAYFVGYNIHGKKPRPTMQLKAWESVV